MGFDESQCTFESDAFAGSTVAVIALSPFSFTFIEVGLSLRPVTGWVTVILQVVETAPSPERQVIVAVPGPTPLIRPFELTATTFLLLVDHLTVVSDTVAGVRVAVNCLYAPTSSETLAKLSDTLVAS